MTQPISKKVDFREDGVTINMNLQKKNCDCITKARDWWRYR